MYRDSIRFITKIDVSNMPPHIFEMWDDMSELDRLMLIKEANRSALQKALNDLNENHSWAVVEMMKK
jgi:hypothetical protein